MKHMEDRELLASIETMERQAVGYFTSEIQKEQTRNLDYYLSKPFGTEEDGRSQVISSDVWDVIEGMTPIILEPFVSSEDVVRFNPVGADDEKSAQQESDYINWVVTQKNDSFNELHAAVKTGLLQKNAVAKYWWEKSRKATIERYFGLSDDMYALLVQDEDVEITEHNETQSPGPDGQPQLLHDVTI